MYTKRAAFTLVELSIVLVILGLLVGGVLSGQSLIRAAELRSVVTERDKYFTAVNAFRDKYLALPGDMPNAFEFWQNAGVAGCQDATVNTNDGCNGDGDGIIDNNAEMFKNWMHLSLAGLIEGSYNGVAVGGAYSTTNLPRARLEGAWVLGDSIIDGDTPTFASLTGGIYLNLFDINQMVLPSLTQSEAWNIDKKTDDGFSKSGSMRAANTVGSGQGDGLDGGCYDQFIGGNTSNPRDDAYGISSNPNRAGECLLIFIFRK